MKKRRSNNGHHRNTKDHKRLLHATICQKMENLEEMHKFLEKYNLTRLNHDEIEKMKGTITRTEIETVIKKLPTDKSPGPEVFTGEFYQTFREELIPILLKLFQKTAEAGILPN